MTEDTSVFNYRGFKCEILGTRIGIYADTGYEAWTIYYNKDDRFDYVKTLLDHVIDAELTRKQRAGFAPLLDFAHLSTIAQKKVLAGYGERGDESYINMLKESIFYASGEHVSRYKNGHVLYKRALLGPRLDPDEEFEEV